MRNMHAGRSVRPASGGDTLAGRLGTELEKVPLLGRSRLSARRGRGFRASAMHPT